MSKTKKILVIVSSVIIILLIALVLYLLWSFTPGDTKKLEAVANQFKPDSSWVLKSKNVYPPQHACLDGPCGKAYYTWTSESAISAEKFSDVLRDSRFDFTVVGNCDASEVPSGSGATICEAKGSYDSVNIKIYITASSSKPDSQSINLEVSVK